MFQELKLRTTCRCLESVTWWRGRDADDKGGLELNPPYQRGDVWGTRRRRNLIKSLLIGIPIPSLVINDRFEAEWKDDWRVAVIDGKQRITTILMFLDGQLAVPGEWFGLIVPLVGFCDLSKSQRRKFENMPISFAEATLPNLAAEKMVFDLINFGGLQQGEVDID